MLFTLTLMETDYDVHVEWKCLSHTLLERLQHARVHLLARGQGGQRDVPVQSVSASCLRMIATHPKAEHTRALPSAF